MSEKAVFLDKDGTIIEDVPYSVDPSAMVFMPGAAEGLRRLQEAGYRLIVVSNQSGVARGLFPVEALAGVEKRLAEMLAEAGAVLAGFYFCPHHPDGSVAEYAIDCECRKPAAGLIYRAAQEHGIDLARSWFAGDILNDVEAGRAAGCRTILLDNGNETEWVLTRDRLPDHLAPDLAAAAELILCGQVANAAAMAGEDYELAGAQPRGEGVKR
jgi:D-glycero-D-manno-heptose 1,7-bisphosphate phosphatase